MFEDVREGEDPGPVAAPLRLPLDFEAHYLMNQPVWHDYALRFLRTNEAAEEAVHRAFLEVLLHWDILLTEADLQKQTWAILRRVVMSEHLQDFRAELAAMDSGIGLYPALGNLPQRQFDVMVLRFIFDFDTERIAWYLGVTPSTVDYHCRKARERLAPVYFDRYRRSMENPT
ncbi:sigma-70 family RNA polymerase sigma factor [Streptomyces sp. NPDC057429]|uniref:sigma-70 family RNA polymerase sigma factor n=1 Tax=Streptomyces sp. NPDC057429 TaxID=3346130 RepID=UPI0036D0302E